MSDLFTPNADAYRGAHSEGSAGPLMGFMDAFDAAWTSQTRNHSLLAVEQSMRTIEQEQIKKMREAGLRPPKSLDDSEDLGVGPFGGAQFRQGRYSAAAQSIIDGGGWYTDEMITERDKEIETARAQRPDLGLMTYTEMFGKVREQAQEIERKAQGPTSFAGTIGGFVGAAAGAMNPVSDPANFASMAFYGGSGPAGRIALQGVANMGVEAGTMAISNSENILLGKQPTFGEDLLRIGVAGAGGAGGQALGEGIAMGVRRAATGKWFNDVPPPEVAPPARIEPAAEPIGAVPSETPRGRPLNDYPDWESFARAERFDFEKAYGSTRDAKLRSALDLDHVASELDRWDGPLPHEIAPPRTDTRFVTDVEPGVRYDKPYQRYIDSLDTVDDIARRIDPDLFRQYDALVKQRADLEAQIQTLKADVPAAPVADGRVPVLPQVEWRTGRLEELNRDFIQAGQQMRDLAPLVDRAYGAAKKEWTGKANDPETLAFLRRLEEGTSWRYRGDGKPSLTEQPAPLPRKDATTAQGTTVGDAVPLAKLSPELEARVKLDANADAPTRVAAAVTDELKSMDEKVEAFLVRVKKIVSDSDKPKTVPESVPFQEWAAGSKVVTGDGLPKRVYHGTNAPDFEKFSEDYFGDTGGAAKDGFFFSSRPSEASGYAGESGGRVIPVYLAIHDPVEVSWRDRPDTKNLAKADAEIAKLIKQVDAQDKDGLIIRDIGGEKGRDLYMAINPDQIANALSLEGRFKAPVDRITLPDGTSLRLDEKVPYVDADGTERQMSVLDYLREMDKDQQAMQSVMTCSRPS